MPELPRLLAAEPAPDLMPALGAWFCTELGQELLQAERCLLDSILPDLFGFHGVQLGQVVIDDLMSSSRVLHRVVVSERPGGEGQSLLQARPEQLPLASDSVDMVFIHHGLDTSANPHALLREASRVLIPEGHLLVMGFNPWSLWGLWRLLRLPWSQTPWLRRALGPGRLVDWLTLLDMEVVGLESTYFRPPLASSGLRRRLGWLDVLGRRCWGRSGAGYALLARKRVSCITPIRPKLRLPARAMSPVLVAEARQHAGHRDVAE